MAIAVAICFTTAINAQSTEKEEVDAIQANFGMEKKKLIVELIKMTPEQSAKFWPIYDAYEVERKALGRERVEMIKGLADAYSDMTPVKADAVTMQTMAISNKTDKLMEKYYNSMKKSVGSEVGFEFYQAESYILTTVRASIMEQIPLFGHVKKAK